MGMINTHHTYFSESQYAISDFTTTNTEHYILSENKFQSKSPF